MIRFAHIEFLWALALVPAAVLLYLWVARWKRNAIASLGDRQVINLMIPEVSFKRPLLKFTLFIIAYASLVLALADPQIGSKMEDVKRKGSDLMILLDVSNSMLSHDLSPSRLESAKRAIAQMIDNLHDDRIGIIVFAGQAYVQLPVTTDYSAAKLFLNTINTNMVPVQGTAIGAAIDLGMQSFDFKDGTSKAMIIITDGENHEDDAVAATKAARDKDVVVSVIGEGSEEGSPIPILVNGKESGFHTDSLGKTVISKLDENMCKEIAEAGDGVYVRATNASSGLNIVLDQVGKMQKKQYESKTFKDFEDRFQIFIALALILLLVEFFLSNRKNLSLSKLKLFEVNKK
ncbi:hypothetical protein BEL04_02670 [Mucilaginibacter sp. PPCGB 2223]|uniref:vWA domain-containing protein n=1 Tax=Mucilaginibacter sp. PPCGB 2223 TaxID=1886027 RepID=UPI0008256535|nr:VWA domain-containing protein [Mucilaginibacter sp. PPCGB 2223]OCX53228.1 hypothetical protein BEL04_02670 [Mucilaginibacter sp. PPCGB 2223]